jgi:hypothetical protein
MHLVFACAGGSPIFADADGAFEEGIALVKENGCCRVRHAWFVCPGRPGPCELGIIAPCQTSGCEQPIFLSTTPRPCCANFRKSRPSAASPSFFSGGAILCAVPVGDAIETAELLTWREPCGTAWTRRTRMPLEGAERVNPAIDPAREKAYNIFLPVSAGKGMVARRGGVRRLGCRPGMMHGRFNVEFPRVV